MTDSELMAKKLAQIETYVRELRAAANPDKVLTDVKEERFAAHTLQLAIQSALDVASHIVSDERLGEPRTDRELFTLLEQHEWIKAALAQDLQNMAGFRNILIHGYQRLVLSVLAGRFAEPSARPDFVCRSHPASVTSVLELFPTVVGLLDPRSPFGHEED